MSRIKLEGRAAGAVGLLVGLALVWTAVQMVPGLASTLGIRGGHEFTFLRWGSMYTEARPGAWLIGSPKRRSSLLFASSGETIVLTSRAAIDRGRVMVSLHSGALVGPEVYKEHVTASGMRETRVAIPETGFYRVMANYFFTFRGRHDLDWQIE